MHLEHSFNLFLMVYVEILATHSITIYSYKFSCPTTAHSWLIAQVFYQLTLTIKLTHISVLTFHKAWNLFPHFAHTLFPQWLAEVSDSARLLLRVSCISACPAYTSCLATDLSAFQ